MDGLTVEDKIAQRALVISKSTAGTVTAMKLHKKIDDPRQEKLFYNPVFRDANGKVITINATCERHNAFTYGQIQDEFERKNNKLPHITHVANIFKRVHSVDLSLSQDYQIFDIQTQEYVPLIKASHKFIYNQLIARTYINHHSVKRWTDRFPNQAITWDLVWKSLNNPVSSVVSKSTVWEQVHLNDYTTSSYNRWHKTQVSCPLCLLVPASRFHITVDCPLVVQIWKDISPHLLALHPAPVSDMEMAFGLSGQSPNVLLRNYMTFLLRECIADRERAAYHNKKGPGNIVDIKIDYNQRIKDDVNMKFNAYKHLGRLKLFEEVFAYNNYLLAWEKDEWQILTIFDLQ